MSTPAAIATVTAILQHLLVQATSGADITTKPLAAARNGGNSNQLNLFLYATHVNTAFSNASMPRLVRNGESSPPPLALVLKYLLTAYGANDDDISGQGLMGQAMSTLHDHPVLGESDIEGIIPDSDLQNQIERLRITPVVLSLDDMSKLWSSSNAEYRLSTGYEVSVVLIESTRAGSAALPVLKRGGQDQGAHVLAASSPVLSGLRFPNQKPGAELGDLVTILGEQMASEEVMVRFRHPLLDTPIEIQPGEDRSQTEIHVQLPDQAADPQVGSNWPAGFYTLSLVIQKPDVPVWTTNELALPLSPQITGVCPTSAPAGNLTLTIECIPQVRDDQRVALIFGNRTVAPDTITTPADPTAPSTLTFTVVNAEARTEPYTLRLRIDGVDSIPVDFSGATPQFADDQKLTIT
jgi:Pvc16 N-terminal domain